MVLGIHRPESGVVRGRLSLVESGLRIGEAVDGCRQAPLAHPLDPKAIELIHRHVHVDAVRDDPETLATPTSWTQCSRVAEPDKKSKQIEVRRLRAASADTCAIPAPAPSGRDSRAAAEARAGLLVGIEFVKSLRELARDGVDAERTLEPAASDERGRTALTDLFEEARNDRTPILVERVVSDIDEIVRHMRHEAWPATPGGRATSEAGAQTLFEMPPAPLHADQELFDRAYGYVRPYCRTTDACGESPTQAPGQPSRELDTEWTPGAVPVSLNCCEHWSYKD